MDGSQPDYGIVASLDVMVEMRDGVRLATDVYRPAAADGAPAPGRFPAILGRTSYDKSNPVLWVEPVAKFFTRHGYVTVVQDLRGRGRSEGVGQYFHCANVNEGMDGYDTIEWIAGQAWSNGRVGMTGSLARRHRPEHGRALPSAAPCSAVGGRGADFRLRLDVPRGRRDGPAHVRRPLPARLRRARDPGRPRGAAAHRAGRGEPGRRAAEAPAAARPHPHRCRPQPGEGAVPLLLRRLLHRVLAAGVCRSDHGTGIASPTSGRLLQRLVRPPSPPTWPRSTRCRRDAAGRRNGCCSGRGATWGCADRRHPRAGGGLRSRGEVGGRGSTARSACGGSIAGSRSWTRGWTPIRRCACSSWAGAAAAGPGPVVSTTRAAGEARRNGRWPVRWRRPATCVRAAACRRSRRGGGGRRGGEMDARPRGHPPCPPSAEAVTGFFEWGEAARGHGPRLRLAAGRGCAPSSRTARCTSASGRIWWAASRPGRCSASAPTCWCSRPSRWRPSSRSRE